MCRRSFLGGERIEISCEGITAKAAGIQCVFFPFYCVVGVYTGGRYKYMNLEAKNRSFILLPRVIRNSLDPQKMKFEKQVISKKIFFFFQIARYETPAQVSDIHSADCVFLALLNYRKHCQFCTLREKYGNCSNCERNLFRECHYKWCRNVAFQVFKIFSHICHQNTRRGGTQSERSTRILKKRFHVPGISLHDVVFFRFVTTFRSL